MQKEIPNKLQVAKDKKESGYSDTLVLRFETAEEVLTPKRREIINTIGNNEIESVTHLSELVDRDLGRVSKDLKELYETDIIDLEEENGSKVPKLKHEIVDIEPIVFERS